MLEALLQRGELHLVGRLRLERGAGRLCGTDPVTEPLDQRDDRRLGRVHGSKTKKPVEDGPFIGLERLRSGFGRGARQRPVLLPEPEETARRKLGDRQIAAHGEVDDGRRDVLRVRVLVDEQPDLRRAQLLRRLVFRDDGLVLAVVATCGPPVPRNEAKTTEHRDQRATQGERVHLEVLRDLAVASLEDRHWCGHGALAQRSHDRELVSRAQRARRAECRLSR